VKTALELLGNDYISAKPVGAFYEYAITVDQLERFARRAREESYEEIDAAAERIKDDLRDYVDASEALRRVRIAIRTIRALPTDPTK
jgi:glutamyl-tRNA reductase